MSSAMKQDDHADEVTESGIPVRDRELIKSETKEEREIKYARLNDAVSRGDANYLAVHLFDIRGLLDGLTGDEDESPLLIACSRGDIEMVKSILGQMSNDVEELRKVSFCGGRTPLGVVIDNGQLGIVEELIKKYPKLPDIPISDDGMLPVTAAAIRSRKEIARFLFKETSDESLLRANQASELLRGAIANGILDIALDISSKWPRVAVVKNSKEKPGPMAVLAARADLFRDQRFLSFGEFPNWQARLLLLRMINVLSLGSDKTIETEALYHAVRCGNRDFVVELIKRDPSLLYNRENEKHENLLELAVEFQQPKIFSLYFGMDGRRELLLQSDMILNIAAKPPTEPYIYPMIIPLQLQHKLKWFKEVEAVVPVSERSRNKDKDAPWKKFQENYEPMRKEAETWMKGTATSCSVVAILIATITFQAVFTVPGGLKSDSGEPTKLTNASFLTFVISDILAFFCSATATFSFLGILTEKHLIEDFMRRLPLLMIIGQLFLVLSVVLMIVAFCTAVFTGIHYAGWVIASTVVVACFPIGVFISMHLPLLRDMIKSTLGKGSFDRDTKPWIV